MARLFSMKVDAEEIKPTLDRIEDLAEVLGDLDRRVRRDLGPADDFDTPAGIVALLSLSNAASRLALALAVAERQEADRQMLERKLQAQLAGENPA